MILRIAVPTPLPRLFDYLPPEGQQSASFTAGIRVKVPFGKRELIGILVEVAQQSPVPLKQLKPAIAILDSTSLFTPSLLKLLPWASEYYHHSLGEVFAVALPKLLRQEKNTAVKQKYIDKLTAERTHTTSSLKLSSDQQNAVTSIVNSLNTTQSFLLHGITGSGKTEVYLQVVEKVLAQDKQVLILVPEISLTPQIIQRFQERFSAPLAALHSNLNDQERLAAWMLASEGKVKIIIGTRSAIFTPLKNPGIIIVDEEHDLSFKQQDSFRYSARDLAIKRAQLENVPVVLGSATPSLESLFNVEQKRYQYLSLNERAGNALVPNIKIIDLRNQYTDSGLSPVLLKHIQQHLTAEGQILLFLNRRGFAPLLICQSCGWVASCHRCDAKMTLHYTPLMLQCHHCGSQEKVYNTCPECKEKQLLPQGLGTQRLEETLKQKFPGIGIARIDRDNTRRKGTLQEILTNVEEGKTQILIGTQMLAKGHHFPNVTLVAILNADNGLFSADFRANERIAQLLVQVSGRAGRAEKPGEVFIQTYHPENHLLQKLITENYASFAQVCLTERKAANLPPYSYHALLRAEAISQEYPMQFLQDVKDFATKHLVLPGLEWLGPIPSLLEKKAGRYRAQLLLQATTRQALHRVIPALLKQIETLPLIRKVRWSLDVDPSEII